jgi:NTE family protein
LFAPVKINGVHYVDGGLFMNLPASVIRKQCEKVVAINVSPLNMEQYKMNIIGIALRSYHLMFRANSFKEMEYCDLLIEPGNLSKYSNRELEKAEEIFNHGYETANHLITELLEEKGKIWK